MHGEIETYLPTSSLPAYVHAYVQSDLDGKAPQSGRANVGIGRACVCVCAAAFWVGRSSVDGTWLLKRNILAPGPIITLDAYYKGVKGPTIPRGYLLRRCARYPMPIYLLPDEDSASYIHAYACREVGRLLKDP